MACISVACRGPTDTHTDLGGLRLLFQVPTPGASSIVVPGLAADGDKIFVGINFDLRAFDQTSGALLWTFPSAGSPEGFLARSGQVMWATANHAVAVDAATGTFLWEYVADSYSGFSHSAADATGFYFGSQQHRVYALNAADGSLRWVTDVGPTWQSEGIVRGVAVSGDTVYAAVEHPGANTALGVAEIFAFDAATGAILWNVTYGDGTGLSIVQSAPRIAGRLLLVEANWQNTVIAIDRFTTDIAWRQVMSVDALGPREAPEIADGTAYTASFPHASALDLNTGTFRWRTPIKASTNFFSVCGSRLLVQDFAIEVIDRNSGSLLARGFRDPEFARTDFVVVGTVAYVLTTKSLLAFQCPTD